MTKKPKPNNWKNNTHNTKTIGSKHPLSSNCIVKEFENPREEKM